jgi:hypothetical protein
VYKLEYCSDLKNAVFWDVAPCTSCMNWRLGGTFRLHLQGRKIRERETSVSRWWTSVHIGSRRHHIPENGILHSHRLENLKSYKLVWFLLRPCATQSKSARFRCFFFLLYFEICFGLTGHHQVWKVCLRSLLCFPFDIITCRGCVRVLQDGFWIVWLELLIPYTHHSVTEAITALFLIYTLYSSPLHTH